VLLLTEKFNKQGIVLQNMVDVIDDEEPVLIRISEDLTAYDHTPVGDPYLSVDPSTRINITDLPRDTTSALKKIGTFAFGAFDLKFHMNLSRFDMKPAGVNEGGGIFLGPCFRRDEGVNYPPEGTEAIFLLVRTYGNGAACRLVNKRYAWNTPEGVGPEMWMSSFLNHDYYIHLFREITADTSTLNVAFYDDFDMTIPSIQINPNVGILPLLNGDTPVPDIQPFPYFVAMAAFNGAPNPDYYTTGVLENFQLQY